MAEKKIDVKALNELVEVLDELAVTLAKESEHSVERVQQHVESKSSTDEAQAKLNDALHTYDTYVWHEVWDDEMDFHKAVVNYLTTKRMTFKRMAADAANADDSSLWLACGSFISRDAAGKLHWHCTDQINHMTDWCCAIHKKAEEECHVDLDDDVVLGAAWAVTMLEYDVHDFEKQHFETSESVRKFRKRLAESIATYMGAMTVVYGLCG